MPFTVAPDLGRPFADTQPASLAGAAAIGRRPLGIVHVVSSLEVGGMEQFVLRLAIAQKTAGHRVKVVVLRHGPLLVEAKRAGLDITVLAGGRLQASSHSRPRNEGGQPRRDPCS